jgi:hypothetical protein
VTNTQIRSWYLNEVSKIADPNKQWVRRGDALEQRARRAWQLRHDLRLKAREMMEDALDGNWCVSAIAKSTGILTALRSNTCFIKLAQKASRTMKHIV